MNVNQSNTMGWDFLKSTFQFSALAFLIFFVHAILGSLNDTHVITTSGSEDLSVLKSHLFLPELALFGLFVLFYRVDRIKTFFYLAGSIFLSFFGFMAISNAMLSETAAQNQLLITLNYYLSAMWPVMFALLFWVAANQRFTTKQASICYPIILILAFLKIIPVDMLMRNTQDVAIFYTVISICTICIMALCTFLFNDSKTEAETPNNLSISLRQKITYITLLALIFICVDIVNQGLLINFKGSLKGVYSDFESFTHFMENFSVFQGGVTTILTCMTCWMACALGWRMSALIIPAVSLLLLGFYWHAEMHPMAYESLTTLVDGFPQDAAPVLILSLFLAIFKGLSVLLLTTKQMALIPLPSSTKARAYAFLAIILGGQSTSNMLFALSLALFDPSLGIQWFIYPVLIAIIVWIAAILLLGKRYEALNALKTT